MSEKPIIRHCRNCEWGKRYFGNSIECQVTYNWISYNEQQRTRALSCRHFKAKENEHDGE